MDDIQLGGELQIIEGDSHTKTVPSKSKEPPVLELHAEEGQRYGLVETMGWLLVMAFLARKDQE